VQDVDGGVVGRQPVGEFAGAIGRIVIHHQHVNGHRQAEKALCERRKVLPLVVGRHNDKGLVHVIEARG
jgi:hypothetical protein